MLQKGAAKKAYLNHRDLGEDPRDKLRGEDMPVGLEVLGIFESAVWSSFHTRISVPHVMRMPFFKCVDFPTSCTFADV
jgi:hypothetical protein